MIDEWAVVRITVRSRNHDSRVLLIGCEGSPSSRIGYG